MKTGCGERYVRQITLSIMRHAWTGLPGGLRVNAAWSSAGGKKVNVTARVRVSAALVPHFFRNVAKHRRLVRGICRRPIGPVVAVLVKFRPAHGYIEWRRSQAAHFWPVSRWPGVRIVTARSA